MYGTAIPLETASNFLLLQHLHNISLELLKRATLSSTLLGNHVQEPDIVGQLFGSACSSSQSDASLQHVLRERHLLHVLAGACVGNAKTNLGKRCLANLANSTSHRDTNALTINSNLNSLAKHVHAKPVGANTLKNLGLVTERRPTNAGHSSGQSLIASLLKNLTGELDAPGITSKL